MFLPPRSSKEQYEEFVRLLPAEGELLGGESGPQVLGDREVRSTSHVSWGAVVIMVVFC